MHTRCKAAIGRMLTMSFSTVNRFSTGRTPRFTLISDRHDEFHHFQIRDLA